MIEERDIRARRPCCIPRSNRRIATFGDGCGWRREASVGCTWETPCLLWGRILTTSMSTLTSRTVNHGIRMLDGPERVSANHLEGMAAYCAEVEKEDIQHRHTEREPEVLLADHPNPIRVPGVRVEVVTITEHDEDPGYEKTRSSASQRSMGGCGAHASEAAYCGPARRRGPGPMCATDPPGWMSCAKKVIPT